MRVIYQNDSHIYSEHSQFTLMDKAMKLSILGTSLRFLKDYYILQRDNSKSNETASYQGF
jgi:hypothetical protein